MFGGANESRFLGSQGCGERYYEIYVFWKQTNLGSMIESLNNLILYYFVEPFFKIPAGRQWISEFFDILKHRNSVKIIANPLSRPIT